MDVLRLGQLVREKRGDDGIRAAAKAAGISPATLSRVERGHVPDMLTFQKICQWLAVDPAVLLGSAGRTTEHREVSDIAPAVHFRAGITYTPQAASDLALLILAAHAEIVRRNLG